MSTCKQVESLTWCLTRFVHEVSKPKRQTERYPPRTLNTSFVASTLFIIQKEG